MKNKTARQPATPLSAIFLKETKLSLYEDTWRHSQQARHETICVSTDKWTTYIKEYKPALKKKK